jgi:hypothetical protein
VAVGQFLNVGGGVVDVHPWIVGLGLPAELIGVRFQLFDPNFPEIRQPTLNMLHRNKNACHP